LNAAVDREETYGKMHSIANDLVETRKQMKDAKEQELELRKTLQGYDEKFTTLQGSLSSTNTAYNAFSGDMQAMAKKTRALETETLEWQKRWEENNSRLVTITKDHEAIQIEVGKCHDSLFKITSLYHALDKERTSLLKKLGRDINNDPLKEAAKETLEKVQK